MNNTNFLHMKKTIILSFIIIFMFVASFARSQDYIVGPGDVLDISVYDNPDMTTTVRVSGDGVIILPLLNQIDVAGLTISQVSDKVVTLLADGYIVNPQVNVFVTEYRSKKAVILGQVVSPGLYELRGHTTLLELVSEAGQLIGRANFTANRRILFLVTPRYEVLEHIYGLPF